MSDSDALQSFWGGDGEAKVVCIFFSGECTSSKYDLVYSKEVLRNENDENRAKKLVRDIDKK